MNMGYRILFAVLFVSITLISLPFAIVESLYRVCVKGERFGKEVEIHE